MSCETTYPGYFTAPLVPIQWLKTMKPDANIVQEMVNGQLYIGTVASDCNDINPDAFGGLAQSQSGGKDRFKLLITEQNYCSPNNKVCVYCPVDCGDNGTCKFDSNMSPYCECSSVTTRDCYAAKNDTGSTTRTIYIPYTGARCENKPAGLPHFFVTDYHIENHGQCFAETADLDCAPGLKRIGCAGGGLQAHICGVENSTDDHQCDTP